jgi:hypothetical protein
MAVKTNNKKKRQATAEEASRPVKKQASDATSVIAEGKSQAQEDFPRGGGTGMDPIEYRRVVKQAEHDLFSESVNDAGKEAKAEKPKKAKKKRPPTDEEYKELKRKQRERRNRRKHKLEDALTDKKEEKLIDDELDAKGVPTTAAPLTLKVCDVDGVHI